MVPPALAFGEYSQLVIRTKAASRCAGFAIEAVSLPVAVVAHLFVQAQPHCSSGGSVGVGHAAARVVRQRLLTGLGTYGVSRCGQRSKTTPFACKKMRQNSAAERRAFCRNSRRGHCGAAYFVLLCLLRLAPMLWVVEKRRQPSPDGVTGGYLGMSGIVCAFFLPIRLNGLVLYLFVCMFDAVKGAVFDHERERKSKQWNNYMIFLRC